MPSDIRKELASPVTLSVLMPVYNERFLVEAAIRRVLEFRHAMVSQIELVVVDDGSTDGTREILRRLAAELPQIRLFEQELNRGKGAAIRRAVAEATGELCVIQDADLEYDPEDWEKLLRPFFEHDADAVYGSRFSNSEYRRVLYYWHTLGNQFLTLLSNVMTDLNLTDMETCYKMMRTGLLKSIPLRSSDFSIEPEITAKLAKRGAVIYEVPIRYAGRTYREGKKISARHGLTALWAILKWKLIDDMFHEDAYGSAVLGRLSHVAQLQRWTADAIAEDLGNDVLEVGAGLGNLTMQLLPRARYVASDINDHYLAYLENLAVTKPYLEVRKLDLRAEGAFRPLAGQFDTVLCVDVLEHVEEALVALHNVHLALRPRGKVIILVPQGQWLYSSLDETVGHTRRYSRKDLLHLMEQAGFEGVRLRDFNKVGVVGWLLNGRVLHRRHFSTLQLKLFNEITPIIRHLDAALPWHGLDLIATGEKV
jgi:glycosyltransferase involved in cell wall biosynthesis